ncbi:putative structural polyprotein [Wuhan insect virus 19]|uniref:putative structural polyprotein n=1 Tax=Wuhan insect virus 19 TaxID=1923723 RepID=UPI00090CB315|nr:putative structural polyprotein [Wuhan insect virus 19]APG77335.1 putative structural polyprotein [Wuhan insect virus 19]
MVLKKCLTTREMLMPITLDNLDHKAGEGQNHVPMEIRKINKEVIQEEEVIQETGVKVDQIHEEDQVVRVELDPMVHIKKFTCHNSVLIVINTFLQFLIKHSKFRLMLNKEIQCNIPPQITLLWLYILQFMQDQMVGVSKIKLLSHLKIYPQLKMKLNLVCTEFLAISQRTYKLQAKNCMIGYILCGIYFMPLATAILMEERVIPQILDLKTGTKELQAIKREVKIPMIVQKNLKSEEVNKESGIFLIFNNMRKGIIHEADYLFWLLFLYVAFSLYNAIVKTIINTLNLIGALTYFCIGSCFKKKGKGYQPIVLVIFLLLSPVGSFKQPSSENFNNLQNIKALEKSEKFFTFKEGNETHKKKIINELYDFEFKGKNFRYAFSNYTKDIIYDRLILIDDGDRIGFFYSSNLTKEEQYEGDFVFYDYSSGVIGKEWAVIDATFVSKEKLKLGNDLKSCIEGRELVSELNELSKYFNESGSTLWDFVPVELIGKITQKSNGFTGEKSKYTYWLIGIYLENSMKSYIHYVFREQLKLLRKQENLISRFCKDYALFKRKVFYDIIDDSWKQKMNKFKLENVKRYKFVQDSDPLEKIDVENSEGGFYNISKNFREVKYFYYDNVVMPCFNLEQIIIWQHRILCSYSDQRSYYRFEGKDKYRIYTFEEKEHLNNIYWDTFRGRLNLSYTPNKNNKFVIYRYKDEISGNGVDISIDTVLKDWNDNCKKTSETLSVNGMYWIQEFNCNYDLNVKERDMIRDYDNQCEKFWGFLCKRYEIILLMLSFLFIFWYPIYYTFKILVLTYSISLCFLNKKGMIIRRGSPSS